MWVGTISVGIRYISCVPRASPTLVDAGDPFQRSIPVASNILQIYSVWDNLNSPFSNILISIPKNSDTDSPLECYQS